MTDRSRQKYEIGKESDGRHEHDDNSGFEHAIVIISIHGRDFSTAAVTGTIDLWGKAQGSERRGARARRGPGNRHHTRPMEHLSSALHAGHDQIPIGNRMRTMAGAYSRVFGLLLASVALCDQSGMPRAGTRETLWAGWIGFAIFSVGGSCGQSGGGDHENCAADRPHVSYPPSPASEAAVISAAGAIVQIINAWMRTLAEGVSTKGRCFYEGIFPFRISTPAPFHVVSQRCFIHSDNLIRMGKHCGGSLMFMMLMDGLAWLVVIGLAVLLFMFASAGLGALIGNLIVAVRRKLR